MRLSGKLQAIPWALLVIAGLGVGCKGGTALSKQDEINIGRDGSAAIEKEMKLDPDPNHQQLAQEIGQKIVLSNDLKDYPYTFKVLDSKDVNAISLPGGPVYVYRGLFEMANRDELASVVAHEIAHIHRRHIAKQYTNSLWMQGLAAIVTGGKGSTVMDIGMILGQLSFSRKDEYESDDYGIRFAYKAGFDPNGMVTFFKKLKAKEKSGDKGILANLRTHPLTENRVARAEQNIAKTTGAPPPPKGSP